MSTATLTVTFDRPARATPRPVGCSIPRVARQVALAHEIDRRIHAGEFDDLAHAARAFGLTRARVTQISNLILLAPAIQAEILAMAPVATGRDVITERTLRPIVAEADWTVQIAIWARLRKELK